MHYVTTVPSEACNNSVYLMNLLKFVFHVVRSKLINETDQYLRIKKVKEKSNLHVSPEDE